MARGTKRGTGRGGEIGAALRGLVEEVVDRVLARVVKELPDRQQVRSLELQVRSLSRRIGARAAGGTGRGVGRPRLNRRCKVARCSRPHVAHGYCSRHYQAWRRNKMRGEAPARRTVERK